MTDASTFDPARCPICGGDNECAMAAGNAGPCWCERVQFGADVLARIPDEARGRACVCPRCAAGASPDASP